MIQLKSSSEVNSDLHFVTSPISDTTSNYYESESHENVESELPIIPPAKSTFDEIIPNFDASESSDSPIIPIVDRFDELIVPEINFGQVSDCDDITDKEQEFITSNQRWCIIHWIVSALMFILILYIIYVCIKVCSMVPVEKTVEAQNYMKNIITFKKLSPKDEMYNLLI